MKSPSLYVHRESFVHEIDGITKLMYVLFIFILPLLLPGLTVVCVLFSLFLLAAGGVIKNSLPIFAFVSFVLVTVVIIQGLFGVDNTTPAFQIFGLVFYREGLSRSVDIILRVVNIISAFLILVLTTKPSDLVEDLVKKGLSPRIGYVIISVFQVIPQMMATVDTIMDAQRSRGMETEGNIFVRVKAFIPLLGPVVLNSFIHTKERAMALEVRAFSAKAEKTFLVQREEYKFAKAMRNSMALILILAAAGRFIL